MWVLFQVCQYHSFSRAVDGIPKLVDRSALTCISADSLSALAPCFFRLAASGVVHRQSANLAGLTARLSRIVLWPLLVMMIMRTTHVLEEREGPQVMAHSTRNTQLLVVWHTAPTEETCDLEFQLQLQQSARCYSTADSTVSGSNNMPGNGAPRLTCLQPKFFGQLTNIDQNPKIQRDGHEASQAQPKDLKEQAIQTIKNI